MAGLAAANGHHLVLANLVKKVMQIGYRTRFDADYQGAVAAYRAGNPVGPSPGAQAAPADYDTAMLALEGAHAVGPSAAAQAGDTDFQAGHDRRKKRRS